MRISVARIQVPRVDWWRVVTDLQANGYSRDHVHHAIGRAQGWLSSLKNVGVEPRYCDGQALLQLWSEVTGRSPSDAPHAEPRAEHRRTGLRK